MKKVTLTFASLMLLIFGNSVSAQSLLKDPALPNVKYENLVVHDEQFDVKINFVDGKVYIMWNIPTENSEGLYKIERSFDVRNFKTVGVKFFNNMNITGYNNSRLLYAYIDENPLQGTSYYRLSKASRNGLEVVSKIFPVNSQSPEFKLFTTIIYQ